MNLRIVLLGLFTACVSLLLAPRQATAVDTAWTYTSPSGHIASSPAVGDVNGDGLAELVTTDSAGYTTAFHGDGQPLWRRHIYGPITIAPTLADVVPDDAPSQNSPLEVLVVNGDGLLHCLDANTGGLIWVYALPGIVDWGRTSISVTDLDHDGDREIITGSTATVVCVTGEGDERWVYTGDHGHTLCPASGDLDGDGADEVLVAGTKTALLCLSSAGKELWRLGDGSTGASPVLWDLDGDARPEVIAAIAKDLVVVNADGAVRWTYTMHAEMDSAISVADADADGAPEIYAVDLAGFLACLAPDGTLRWSGDVGQRVRRSPSIADIDGDGALEILVAGYSQAIHVFNADGTLQEQIPLPGAANATATVMTVGTGDAESWRTGIVCPTQDGSLQAFVWPQAPRNASALWPEYRMNAARAASQSFDQTPRAVQITGVDLGIQENTNNVYRVRVSNPQRHSLTVLLEAYADGGAPQRATQSSSDDPVECSLPYHLVSRDPARLTFTFTCTVSDGDAIITRQQRRAYVAPHMKEIVEAEARLAEIDTLLPQLADKMGAEERACFLETTLRKCRDDIESRAALSVRERGRLIEVLDETSEAVTTLSGVMKAAVATKSQANGSVLVSAANPWAPFGGMDEAIEGRTPPSNLSVEAFDGEVESAALNIFNFGGAPRTFRIDLDPITRGNAGASIKPQDAITLHEVLEVPTLVLEHPSSDALPLINQARTITVPPWSARQLWLSIDTDPLEPGAWSTTVRLRTLESEPVELTAGLAITIWDAALPEKQALSLCHWASVDSTYLKDYPDEALKDQVAHGTNVFVSSYHPIAAYNENGELVGEIDFTAHDDYVRRHAPHGIILFCGYQGALRGPGTHDGPAYQKAYGPWLRAWVKHLAELGVGYDGFALYPIDEIGLYPHLVGQYLMYARLTREADPKVQMYTDPTEGVKDAEFEELVPFVDIWCPNTAGYLFDRNPGKLEFMKSTGNTVWTYECFGVAKHQSPLAYYRAMAWRAWHHGLTGIGFWTYCTTGDNPWFPPPSANEYTMVYGGDGVVTSKRWEAVRDGIEDYAMLATLRTALDAEQARQQHPDAARDADMLLGEKALAIGELTRFLEWDAKPGPEGLADRRRLSDEQWNTYRSMRADIARLLSTLKP